MKEECIIKIYLDDVLDHTVIEKRTIYPGDKARQPMQKTPTHFERNEQGRPILEIKYYTGKAISFSELVAEVKKAAEKALEGNTNDPIPTK